jgi:hypothetical protein
VGCAIGNPRFGIAAIRSATRRRLCHVEGLSGLFLPAKLGEIEDLGAA